MRGDDFKPHDLKGVDMKKYLLVFVVAIVVVTMVSAQNFYGVGVLPDRSVTTDNVMQKDDTSPVIWCKTLQVVNQPLAFASGADEGTNAVLVTFERGNKQIIAASAKMKATLVGDVGKGAISWAIGTAGTSDITLTNALANIASGEWDTVTSSNQVTAITGGVLSSPLSLDSGALYLNVGATNGVFGAAITPMVSGVVKVWYIKLE